MSTRSAVCEPQGDSYRGRYVHSDGYPTGVGTTLLELVQRDGVEKVRQTIIHDHYGWSNLKLTQTKPTKKAMAAEKRKSAAAKKTGEWYYPEYGTPEYDAWSFGQMYNDGRFECVPGYGVAYTDTVLDLMGDPAYQQVTADDWVTPELDSGTEWRYILTDTELWVLVGFGANPAFAGKVTLTDAGAIQQLADLEAQINARWEAEYQAEQKAGV